MNKRVSVSKIWKYALLLGMVILTAGALNAQKLDWQKTFGGSNDDRGSSVQQTTDGGYIITGHTESYGAGGWDVYLIKTDSFGNTIWTNTYGGLNNDVGACVQQTYDSGYIIAGVYNSSSAYLIKTDANGDTLWAKVLTGTANSVIQTPDSGYMITGTSGGNVFLIKTNVDGDTLWKKTYGGTSGNSVQQTYDGGYIIAGYTGSYISGNTDVYLVKTDSFGNALWTKSYGGSNLEIGRSVVQTLDSGYIVVGNAGIKGYNSDQVYVIKTDPLGNTTWTKYYGGDSSDVGYSIQQIKDTGYIIAGFTKSYGDYDGDVYIIRITSSGDTLWTRAYGGNSAERAYSIKVTSDGGYIITGYTDSYGAGNDDVYLIKVSRVALYAPNGGEKLAGGQNYDIKFECADTYRVDHLRLSYSIDDGLTYSLISDNIPPTDTDYVWTVPAINNPLCRLKVQAISTSWDTLAQDVSDNDFIIDSRAPLKVQLAYPLNNAYLNSLVNFIWYNTTDNLSGVEYYIYQRAFDSLFTDGVVEVNTGLDTTITFNLPDSIYYWRVRAVDGAGNIGEWSNIFKVEVDRSAPGTPVQQSPTNNSWVTTNMVIFKWSSVSKYTKSPIRYIIAIDTASSFINPIVVDTTEYTNDTIPLSDGEYYWWVKAYDLAGNEGGWSSVWYVGVDAHAPDAPALVSPTDSLWTNNNSVLFQWTSVSKSPVYYIFEVDTTNTFTTPMIVDTLSLNSITLNLPEDYYYWRVRAYDEAGNQGNWSLLWQFGVDVIAPTIDSITVLSDTGYYFGPFEVEAKAVDNLTLYNPVLYYRVSSGTWMQDTMEVLPANWYVDTIPEIPSQDSAIIEYYITAEDYAGNRTREPDTGTYSFNVSVKEKEKTPVKYEIKNVAMKGKALIIRYGLPKASEVTLKLYDLSGRVVKRINQHSGSGYHEVSIPVSILHKGVYFVEMKAGEYRGIKKVLLFR